MSIKNKWNKLNKNPKLFFSDMYEKRRNYIIRYLPSIKYKTEQKFSVVSAVYGVEKYLNDYFESLVNQTIGFEEHIHLILVDDDSQDNSAEIIKKWMKKYPDNITYVHKENGGQASARNLGMKYVNTEWITFIDPDDFISIDYFEKAARTIDNTSNLGIINCNLIFYYENRNQFSDTHPLKYKFKTQESYCLAEKLAKNIIMSASSSFFKSQIISSNGILFNKDVKPNFEDARFISEYLFYVQHYQVCFLSEAKYYYRKRSDESSTIDNSWKDSRKYLDIFEHGYIFILKFYYEKNQGKIPDFIQRQVLYDLSWYCKHLLNNSASLDILNNEEKITFFNNMKEAYRYIDKKIILDFELAGMWLFFKIGMLGCFKGVYDIKQTAYIERFDRAKKQILISYNSFVISNISIMFDEFDTIPDFYKETKHNFGDNYFITTHKMWVTLPSKFDEFFIKIDGKNSRICIQGKFFLNLSHKILMQELNDLNPKIIKPHWILMDRDNQADDNAEHLYRFIKNKYPEQDMYFVLSKRSHDWNRLKNEGFNLLDFGSHQHERLLRTASKVISSHIDKYVSNYFPDNSMLKQQIIFLQHGVTKDNLSSWLNTKPNLDLMITSTIPEMESIAFGPQYYLTNKQVVLTGFPRHDALINKKLNFEKNSNEKTILIMPTWRQYILLTTLVSNSSKREKNPKFMSTNYAQHWKNFLNSEYLRQLADDNIKIIFAPHNNIEPYIDDFQLPSFIEVWRSENRAIQDLFLESDLMITDYSSVAFEMSYLEKQVLYYQFDEEEFFSNGHVYTSGYFDYRRDGFGPVVTNEKDLINELTKIVNNNFIIEEQYLTRIKNCYPYRDGKCCDRTFEAIKNLDKPSENNINDIKQLKSFLMKAESCQDWQSTIERAKKYLMGKYEHYNVAYELLAKASYYLYQPSIFFDNSEKDIEEIEENNKIKAFILMAHEKWEDAYLCWNAIETKEGSDYYYQLICYGHINESSQLKFKMSDLESIRKDDNLYHILNALILKKQRNFNEAIEKLILCLASNKSVVFLKKYQPELLLADLYRITGKWKESHQQLVNFEKHTKNSIHCCIEIVKLALDRENYSKAINQLEHAFNSNYLFTMPFSVLCDFVSSISYCSDQKLIINCAKTLLMGEHKHKNIAYELLAKASYNLYQPSIFFDNCKIDIEVIEKNSKIKAFVLMIDEKWEDAYLCWNAIENKEESDYYYQLICYTHINESSQLKFKISDLESIRKNDNLYHILNALILKKQKNFNEAIEKLTLCLTNNKSVVFLKKYQPELLLADLYRITGKWKESHQQLVNFEKHTKDSIHCCIEIAKLALDRENYTKAISQLKHAFNNNYLFTMPFFVLCNFVSSLSYCSDQKLIINCAKALLMGERKYQKIAYELLAKASYNLYQSSIFFDNSEKDIEEIEESNKIKAFILMADEKWEDAYLCWNAIETKEGSDYYYQLICYGHINESSQLKFKMSDLESIRKDDNLYHILNALILKKQRNFNEAIEKLILCLASNKSVVFLKKYQPELLLADLYRITGKWKESHQQLINFEKYTKNSVHCCIEIAKLALERENYSKAVNQLKYAFNDTELMPLSILSLYFEALVKNLENKKRRK